jgi:hypothetical protein
MIDHLVPLETLYARFDAFANGRMRGAGADEAHQAVVDRLAENRRVAEGYGWTSCALERAGGMGRLRCWGVPPSEYQRQMVPDWTTEAGTVSE